MVLAIGSHRKLAMEAMELVTGSNGTIYKKPWRKPYEAMAIPIGSHGGSHRKPWN